MIHTVSLKKVVNLSNPYEIIPEGLDKPITLEEVETSLKKGVYLEERATAWTRIKHIQRITHFINSRNPQPIRLNIGNPENNDVPKNILEDGFHRLAAAIYRKDTNILAELHGSEEALNTIFNIDIKYNNNNLFLWNIKNEDLKPTWSNKEYIMQQIISNDENVIKLVDNSLWTIEFLEEISSSYSANNFISNIMKNKPTVLFQENFIKAFSKNFKIFEKLWNSHFKYLFEDDEYNISEITSYPEKNKVKEIINNEIFANKDICLKLLEIDIDYYQYLSKSIKLDKQIINFIFNKYAKESNYYQFNFGEFVPDEYFDDFNNNAKFMNIFYRGEKYDYFELATKNWINDKNKCISMFSEFDDKTPNSYAKFIIYKLLNTNLQKDKDFNLQIVSVNPLFYQHFSNKMKQHIDIIEAACNSPKAIQSNIFSDIPHEAYPLIKNEKIIKQLIKQEPSILEKDNWPKEWGMKKEYLIFLGEKISRVEFKKISGYKEFLKDENLVLNLIENNNRFYHNLSTKDRSNPEYILKYIDFHENKYNSNKDYLKHLSHEIWFDKKFCINAFKVDNDTIKFIPAHFFNQKDFILDFFKMVTPDNQNFVKSYLPKEINHFLTIFNVNNNHHDFFSKFFLNQKLENKLESKEKVIKTHKI